MTIDYVSLGQAIDTTWGRSSTPQTATYSVKFKIISDGLLQANYAAVVNFATEKEMIEMKKRYEKEADNVVKTVVDHVKKTYHELSNETLKVAEESDPTSSIEVIGFASWNPKRTAYYRKTFLFTIS